MTFGRVAEALPRAIRLVGWPKLVIFFFFFFQLRRRRRNILHVSARQHVRSHAAGPNDPASRHQFATIMFVYGHPRHNAQSIIGHINLNIIMFIKFTTSK